MGAAIGVILYLAFIVLMIVSMWKVYQKAGREGWESIVPFYNTWVMAEIAGKPGWWMFLIFIPFVGLIIAIYLVYLFAKSFGKGVGYTLGMIFLPFIFFPMLAFGDATYQGPPKDEIMESLGE